MGHKTRSPAGAGIANRPLVFLGIFLIFGSNTPTWSVENQLNLWATNCVVNCHGLEPGASHGDELSMVTWSPGQRHEQLRGRLVTRDTSLHCLTVL